MAEMDFPFKAEYAKTSRASCKACRTSIVKDTLRIAAMVQSFMFDGKTPQWYHDKCFFTKQRPKSVDEIDHFELLRIEDQKKISAQIESFSNGVILPDKPTKGKKRSKEESLAKKNALKDFKIEYAKSGRALCRGCEQKILKDELRISKKDYTTEVGMKYGGQDMWHHLTCFAKIRAELGYFEGGAILPGYQTLTAADQKEVMFQIAPIKQEDAPDIKKIKTDTQESINGLDQNLKLYEDQNKLFYKNRDNLSNNLKIKDMLYIMEYNNQDVPEKIDSKLVLDNVADIMTFGALERCTICKNGQFVFGKMGYICQGNLTEWAKCGNVVKEPSRQKCRIPPELHAEFPFLKKFKPRIRVRYIKPVSLESVRKVEKEENDENHKPKVERETPVLMDMEFVLLLPKEEKENLKKKIAKLGGKIVTKINKSVMAIISHKESVDTMSSRMQEAQDNGIHVVPVDFLNEVENYRGRIPELIQNKTLCDWGTDPTLRLPAKSTKSGSSKSKSIYTKSVPAKMIMKLKGGGAVDPESELQDIAHVYEDAHNKYTCVLTKTDVQTKKNSFYKMQLLKSDMGNKYWVFRSWGRIGTIIGNNKVESMGSLDDAKQIFYGVYEEKTGFSWMERHNSIKIPGRYYSLDIEYGDDQIDSTLQLSNGYDSNSKLAEPVQNLIRLIFNVENMKKAMIEFELDTQKMPLGKISKNQIQKAFLVLTELSQLCSSEQKEVPLSKFVDASNRFYTYIPHSCGIDNPPIINTQSMIEEKSEMLQNLLDIEIAYNMMRNTTDKDVTANVDAYYEKLHTEIDVLSKESEQFKIIEQYVRNTHAATHKNYDLEIEDVFVIRRSGEEKRYKPFKKLPNRMLLWHGSRVTNYAGILSQGLRIAPPEAPVTGYMFGKGIYFADMVSKSANYCATNIQDSTGLVLLCDVALGNMYERLQADYIEKLPKGKHSIKGVGKTQPDDKVTTIIDGAKVPYGPGVTKNHIQSSLLYNEYIVYDVAQVQVKYLLRMKFIYKF